MATCGRSMIISCLLIFALFVGVNVGIKDFLKDDSLDLIAAVRMSTIRYFPFTRQFKTSSI